MTAPHFSILTQKELTINLSRPAMERVIDLLENAECKWALQPQVQCELDNFVNTLLNLLERSETRASGESPLRRVDNSSSPGQPGDPPETGNLDLIGG